MAVPRSHHEEKSSLSFGREYLTPTTLQQEPYRGSLERNKRPRHPLQSTVDVTVTSPDGSELKEQDISPAALFPPEWEAESSSEGEPRGIPARPSGKIRLLRRGS